MKIVVPKETHPGEKRVALAPEACKKLVKAGFTVSVEAAAGGPAFYSDEAYSQAGAGVESDGAQLLGSADFVLKVNPPTTGGASGRDEVAWMRPGSILLASLMPVRNLDVVRALAERKITSFATDAIPRISRAQAMDTLSSMANITGYKGVLIAAAELNKYFPMLMTAAGMVPPAKVFVIGAAVAGLQAIATAKRLGANVSATDVRPEVKEQIESVGGKYVGIELKESAVAGGGYAKELSEEDKARQREMLVEQCASIDVVITTALIGGIFAPKLIDRKIVSSMRNGSVIVDLAADGGGNCELSRPGEDGGRGRRHDRRSPELGLHHAPPTRAFSSRATSPRFLMAFTEEGKFNLDLSDEIQEGALITHEGEVRHARTKEALEKSARGTAAR